MYYRKTGLLIRFGIHGNSPSPLEFLNWIARILRSTLIPSSIHPPRSMRPLDVFAAEDFRELRSSEAVVGKLIIRYNYNCTATVAREISSLSFSPLPLP